MGFFGKLFEKKECAICGGEIGLLGNRKLEDGNMCKNCAAKLSPWFSDRRNSTIAEIEEQLAYREANREALASFRATRVLSRGYNKVVIDEDAGKFMVTSVANLASLQKLQEANPDIIGFDQVTGVDIDIEEDYTEEKREVTEKDGSKKMVSFTPPRYTWEYDFHVMIRVNSPYFDEIKLRLNQSNVELNPDYPLPQMRKPNPEINPDYCEYKAMAQEIKEILTEGRAQVRAEARAAAAPRAAVTCPYCGATTTPDASGCCEYCGGAVNG
jgi:hypothetical protein